MQESIQKTNQEKIEFLVKDIGFEAVIAGLLIEAKKRALIYSNAKTWVEITWYNYYSAASAKLSTIKWN